MRYLIITLLSLSFVHAAENEPQVPEVLNAFAAFEKVVVEQHKKIDPIIKKAQNDALLKLEAAKVAMMKNNDLKGALMIEEAIKKMQNDEILAAIEQNIKDNANIFGGMTNIVGKWNGNGFTHEYKNNGDATHSMGVSGKWKINGNKLTVTWNNGAIDVIALPIKNNTLIWVDGKFTMTRTK
jgi:hypothetical protein